MDAQTYLKKFSRIVRWKLPKSEADEVLADYQEMLAQCSGETTQAFGQPAQAARLLSEPKMYYRWLAVFGLLTFCLLLSEFFLLRASFAQYPTVRMYLLLFVGLIGSLLWFQPQPGEDCKSSLPKGLGPMLLGYWLWRSWWRVFWQDSRKAFGRRFPRGCMAGWQMGPCC